MLLHEAPVHQAMSARGTLFLWYRRVPNIVHPVILQNGFDILLGRIEITVPWVVDGDDYSIMCAYPCVISFFSKHTYAYVATALSARRLWQRQPRLHHPG